MFHLLIPVVAIVQEEYRMCLTKWIKLLIAYCITVRFCSAFAIRDREVGRFQFNSNSGRVISFFPDHENSQNQ